MEVLEQTDERAFIWLNGWVGHFSWLDAVMRLVVSDYLIPVLLALALLGLWFGSSSAASRWRSQYAVMTSVMSVAIANLVVQIIDQFVFRPRPFDELRATLLFYRPTDSSFPANPAAVAFAIATSVWIWNRKAGTALMLLAGVYGVSRVYAGVFYPLDIVGGALIGAAAGGIAALILNKFEALPVFLLRIARSVYLA